MGETGTRIELRRTYIQTLSAISRSGGYRLGKQLELVVPLVLQQCSTSKSGGDNEMGEACLQAFESFVLRCPKEVTAHLHDISKTALFFLSFDPNYADEEEDDDADGEEMDDDDDDDAEYSDDDDASWKVRRAAAKVLSAIILSRPDKLPGLFPVVAPALIGRFKEREESVKMDVFATFNDLLLQAATGRQLHGPAAADHMVVDDVGSDSTASMLLQEVPRVVKAASRQLREKSVKTRVAALHCMRQLVTTLPGCLSDHVAALVPGVDKALKDNTSNHLRIEALVFLQLVLASHPPAVFQPHVGTLLKPVPLSRSPQPPFAPGASPLTLTPPVSTPPRPPQRSRSRFPAPPFVPPPPLPSPTRPARIPRPLTAHAHANAVPRTSRGEPPLDPPTHRNAELPHHAAERAPPPGAVCS